MKSATFKKRVNAAVLHEELERQGFQVVGVSTREDVETDYCEATVHLPDDEEKDPAPVVEAHVYVEPEDPREALLKSYQAAATPEEKVQVLARALGLE